MHKLAPVEDAKTLFNEAKDWSVWRWLIEKKHARTTADAAWEALEACEEKVTYMIPGLKELFKDHRGPHVIGRARTTVREALKMELAEIDAIVTGILN